MDNFGDIIYLIIMALIFIVGAVNSENKKKKKAEEQKKAQEKAQREPSKSAPEAPKPKSGIPTWEDVLKELMGEPEPPPKPKPVTISTPKTKPISEKKYRTPPRLFLDSKEEGTTFLSPIQLIEDEGSAFADDLEFDNKEELRKAIIYSEIINRRY